MRHMTLRYENFQAAAVVEIWLMDSALTSLLFRISPLWTGLIMFVLFSLVAFSIISGLIMVFAVLLTITKTTTQSLNSILHNLCMINGVMGLMLFVIFVSLWIGRRTLILDP